jgi:carotenoid cleavage dioxygenase-like enzyme
MTAASSTDLPFYLQGNFAPVRDEVTTGELAVTGRLPSRAAGPVRAQRPEPARGDVAALVPR